MNEEEKKAIEIIKKELEDEKKHHNHIYKGILGLYDNGSIEIILNLIDKQQKEIKARLEEIDSLYKMMSVKDDEIDELKKDYQILKDDIEEHRIAYVDTPEFEENYISKGKIKEIKAKWDKSIAWANADDYYYAMKMLDELLGE